MKLVFHDEAHSYWLDGKRAKSGSKVAQIASDSFTVEQWQKRQVAIGMTLDPTLAERVAVDLDNREVIQKVCDEAANTAKANARSNRGVQRHRVFELGLLGRTDMFITDQQKADWKVLERTLDAYGLEPIPDRVEQFVAWPEHGVVGRYDAYLFHHALGMPVLVDLKGGINAVKYPHSTAVQLWIYRNAPWTSAKVDKDGDKSTVTEWTTAPDGAAQYIGYVLYCDDHHDVGELWHIDLRGAQAGAEIALELVDWRKLYNYGKELATQVSSAESGSREALDPDQHAGVTSSAEEPVAAPVNSPDGEQPAVSDGREVRRQRLLTRYGALNEPQQIKFCDLHINPNDLDAVENALNQVKVEPFNVEIPPAPVTPKPQTVPFEPPDEGPAVDDDDITALKERFAKLPLEASLWTGKLVAEGNRGWPFKIIDHPTVRRYEIYRGILVLAEWDNNGADDVVRAIISDLLTADPSKHWEIDFTAMPPGKALGVLTAEQAKLFSWIAWQITLDKFALMYKEDGSPTLTPATQLRERTRE